MTTRDLDPRGPRAWRVLGIALLVTGGAAALTVLLCAGLEGGLSAATGWPATLLAAIWAAAWLVTARFRLFSVRRSRLTLVFLTAVWALTLSGYEGLRVVGLVLGLLFMVSRPHGLRLLDSRRRLDVFLLGGPLLAVTMVGGFGRPEGAAGALLVFCRAGLQVFWLTTLISLLIGMRLHFMRLRPKLLIAGVLVGVIPSVLLTVFGLVLLYGTLGGSRANRARDVLQEAALVYAEGRLPDLFTADPLGWDERASELQPDWAGGLMTNLRQFRQARDSQPEKQSDALQMGGGAVVVGFADDDDMGLGAVAAAIDTVAWVRTGDGLWLVHWRDPAPGQATLTAVALDQAALARLARTVRADVQIRGSNENSTVKLSGSDDAPVHCAARYQDGRTDPAGTWLRRPRYFGTTIVPALYADGQSYGRGYLWIVLQTSFSDLVREFASREAALNMVVLIVLGAIAIVFFIAALTALVFSLRITGGITGAVRALRRGTQRLAAGDLDVVIELENEDEFGELADSFNVMTVAVKQGREDALARARLQQEMATARRIQERLLPSQAPSLAGWEVTGVSLPSLQVGGDYFDFLPAAPERLGLAIGDVSGKGVPAALLMSNLQASLKGQVLNQAPVSEVVARINNLLANSTEPHMFATFIYGELDTNAGTFISANAGHEPPLLVRRDGSVVWLTEGGLLLGMFADQTYETVTTALAPGDVLVLYTDGITEAGAPNPAAAEGDTSGAEGDRPFADDEADDAMFGEQQLAAVVCAARARPALGIREAILSAVQAHLAGRTAGDDITLVVVKRSERDADPA